MEGTAGPAQEQRLKELREWFTPSKEDGLVGDRDHMPVLVEGALAEAVLAAGFNTVHSIASLKEADLGEAPEERRRPQEVEQSVSESVATTAVAVATALHDVKKIATLNGGKSGRPTMAAVHEWQKAHEEYQSEASFGLGEVIREIRKNCKLDIDAHISAEPVSSNDGLYYKKVKASLTISQYEMYGGGENASGLRLMCNVSVHVADCPAPYSALIPVSYTHLTLPTKRIV
eukprot:TRINITY_DN9070_c0_g1_i3.p1 TRINITY_DN9070_c0_g1~~TRINITY_DN9070_c0_g1_i3.p1  ORF type:complete len:231 (+),score=37.79 TRINITY_DN9070_c0_g1_i3:153-845(+)